MTTTGQDLLREQMRATSDPRAARTRQLIVDAVHALAAESQASPTVSDIVRRAGVSRSSFYTQFASTDELTAAVLREAFEQVLDYDTALREAAGLTSLEATRMAIERLVAHFDEHRGFYRLGLSTSPAAYDTAVRLVAEQFQRGRCLTDAETLGVSIEAAATYLAAGSLALLRAWIVGELPGDAAAVTEQMVALLPAWLTAPTRTSGRPVRT